MTHSAPLSHAATTPARLQCPTCALTSAQRIDTRLGHRIIASCVCESGHLFVTEWEGDA